MANTELKEKQKLNDEQLEDVSGGARILSASANENGTDDSVFVGILETAGPKEEDDGFHWPPVLA